MYNYLLDNVKEKGVVDMIFDYSKKTEKELKIEREHLINVCKMRLNKIMIDNFNFNLESIYINNEQENELYKIIKRFSIFYKLIKKDIELYKEELICSPFKKDMYIFDTCICKQCMLKETSMNVYRDLFYENRESFICFEALKKRQLNNVLDLLNSYI